MSIHRLGLNNPGGKILLPQGPENRNKRDWNQNIEQNLARRLVENFTPICSQADRWDVDKFLAAEPKDERGDGHEDARKSESDIRTMQTRAFEKTDNRWRQFGDEAIR